MKKALKLKDKNVNATNALRSWIIGCALAAIGGCSVTQEPNLPDITLAQVNGDPITVEALEDAFTSSHQGHSAFLAGPGVIRELLEKTIDKQLLVQEARRIGLDRDPEVEQPTARLRTARATATFFHEKIEGQNAVTDEAVAEAHKRIGDRFQARQILVESREAAEKLLERIRAGADFAQLATEFSQADTAARGGYMGIIPWGKLAPDFEGVLWSLQQGEVSEPFETKDGWNLLLVTERKSAEPPDLAKTGPAIRTILQKREANRKADVLFRDLQERWKPSVKEAALRELINARDKDSFPSEAVLVEVGEDKITAGQIFHQIDFDKIHKLSEPIALRALKNLLEEQTLKLLITKEALAEGYGDRPEVVKEVEALINKLAVDRLLDRVVFAKLDATDDEARAYWAEHKEKFTEPEAVKLSVLLAESESEAEQALRDLQSGANFAAYIKKLSKDGVDAGGPLGWVNKRTLQPELEKLAFSLAPGKSGMAVIENKYVLVAVEARKPERLKPYAEVKDEAKQLVIKEKAQATLKTWIAKLREASVIQIDDKAVERAMAGYEKKFQQKSASKEG